MAGITHTFVSAVPDDGNPDKVGSGEWNAEHTIAADAIVTASIKDANVTLAKLAADSVDASKVVDGSLTKANLSLSSSLDGVDVKEGTAAYANGMIPVVYTLDLPADGSEASVTITNKIYMASFWFEKVTNEASGAFTVTVLNAGDAAAYINVEDTFNSAGCITTDNVVAVPAKQSVADGGVLSVTGTGATNMAGTLVVLGLRVA